MEAAATARAARSNVPRGTELPEESPAATTTEATFLEAIFVRERYTDKSRNGKHGW